MKVFDVIVVGGGPAGLAAAALCAREGRRTVLVAPEPTADTDPRTVALMQPALTLLDYLGVWPGVLQSETQPLRRLRLVDDTGSMFAAPEVIFDAAETGNEAFGWNIPLALLLPALAARGSALGVSMIAGSATGAILRDRMIEVSLADGTCLKAAVALAADGRCSVLRKAAGIAVRETAYDQSAIATSFAHSAPHGDISTEYHGPAGPFTTVPMPGNRSSLVWMDRPARADDLMSLSDDALACEIQLRTHGELGRVSAIGSRRLFPMRNAVADRFGSRRTMLIGETAHVVPPIGAQGLNMSLRDAAHAADVILAHDDPGSEEAMADYEARRRPDVALRRFAVDAMNRSLLSGFLPLEGARAAGLSLLQKIPLLRQHAMRLGLGGAGTLPYAMRARGKIGGRDSAVQDGKVIAESAVDMITAVGSNLTQMRK